MIDNKGLTEMIAFCLDKLGIDCVIEDIGGREAVTAEYGGGETDPEDFSVTVENLTDDTTEIHILITVICGLDTRQTEDLGRVLGRINRHLKIGNFSVIPDGALFFDYAFVIDEEQSAESVMAALLASLDAVSSTAAGGKQMLLPLLHGEITAEQFAGQDLFIEQ